MGATNELIMIKHGSRRKREKGPPQSGLQVQTETFGVSSVPPHIIDLKLKTTDNFMVMQLGPDYPIIGRTGSEFTCKATSTKGVIAFHFSDDDLSNLLAATDANGQFNFNIRRPKFDDHLLQLFRLANNELLTDQPDTFYIEHLLSASIIRTLSIYAGISIGQSRSIAVIVS